ncbi:MAG: hypothetical protein QOJ56_6673 [Mycobacterium sp.]|jgi:hypothetical protein|nr:hypothetical protein [Mycobacterium sp.]
MSRRIIAARRYSATSRRRSTQARALEMPCFIEVASLARASKVVPAGACAAAAGLAVPHAERRGGR